MRRDPEEQERQAVVSGQELDPLVRKVLVEVPAPSLRDNRGDLDRVLDTLVRETGMDRPRVPLELVRRISDLLHGSGLRLTLTLGRRNGDWEVLDAEEGDRRRDNYGLAVDLGSTNMVFYLLDLTQGTILESSSAENPQVRYGEDILSRIHHCEDPRGLGELQEVVVEAFAREIGVLSRRRNIAERHLYALSLAGNTTMGHLFLGLSPRRICREPYLPVVNRCDLYPASALGLPMNARAPVYLLPNVGSYVGGDLLAGILVSGMHKKEGLSILVDVGTNAEIVLGNRDWLMVAAGAAGPALEGGVVGCGMRAAAGAIERVRIDRTSLRAEYSTIGGAAPRGICGSGLIDLMAELFLAGAIDERGRITAETEAVCEVDGVRAYRVVPVGRSGTGREILLTERDLENLLRTKAAMYTALTVITRHAGVSFGDVEHFYVAGTFGGYIDPAMAVCIGMMPDIPLERYVSLYNSAGQGACLCLLSNAAREEMERIRRRITYLELNVDGDFMHLLNAAMFLPHTDTAQFPSVERPRK